MTDPVPDFWPAPSEGPTVPMFPLAGVFLFPRQVMPLHIFEPRYRQMIEDSLDGPGRLVMGTILENEREAPDHVPRVLPVGGLGEIARHDQAPDGRFYVWLVGLARVGITEVDSDRPYRRVQIHPLDEITPESALSQRLDSRLRRAVTDRADESIELPDELPVEVLVDLLCQGLRVPQRVMEEVYAERDVGRRAELALAAHARYG